MKRAYFNFFVAVVISGLFACSGNEQAKKEFDPANVLAENKVEVDMKVEGMVCAMGCAKFIEDKVADLDGIVLSQVNFEEGIAHFELDQSVITPEEVERFIDDIHDGQYEAEILTEEEPLDTEEEVSEGDSDELTQVNERFQISFPQLLGYFLKNLR